MTTDETAKAILASDKPAFIPSGLSPTVDAAMAKYFANYHADLQQMARLWLMRDDLRKALTEFGANCPNHEDTFENFEALEEK